MKRESIALFFSFCLCLSGAGAAVTINKAPSVKSQPKQDTATALTANSLIGTAIGLVGSVQSMKQQQLALAAGCAPSSSDVTFVNEMVKEYAKTGKEKASEMINRLLPNGNSPHCKFIDTAGVKGGKVCYSTYDATSDDSEIWSGYPKAESDRKCPPEKQDCADKDKKYYSNVYEIYNAMGWSDEDLLPNEVSNHSRIMAKMEECSPEILKRKNQELQGQLITGALGGIGQKQNTAGTMVGVSSLVQGMGGGGGGVVSGLSGLGTQMLPTIIGGGLGGAK